MGWWVALGVITLLAVLPLGASVRYDEDGILVRLIIGSLKITLFPRPKKDKKPKNEKKTQKETKQPEPPAETPPQSEPAQDPEPAAPAEQPTAADSPALQEQKPKKKSGGPITDFLPLVRIVLDMLTAFRRRLRVNVLELKLIMAGDDPCDLAVNYGRTWAAIGNLQPQLERFLVIKKRKIEVECDFTASEMLVIARLDLTITLGRIIATVVVYGVRALIEFLKINKKRKGGASQ